MLRHFLPCGPKFAQVLHTTKNSWVKSTRTKDNNNSQSGYEAVILRYTCYSEENRREERGIPSWSHIKPTACSAGFSTKHWMGTFRKWRGTFEMDRVEWRYTLFPSWTLRDRTSQSISHLSNSVSISQFIDQAIINVVKMKYSFVLLCI